MSLALPSASSSGSVSVSAVVSFLIAAAASAGCGLVGFDVEQKIPEQQVQGSPLGGLLPASFLAFPLSIDIESQTKAQGTGPARSAALKAIELSMTAPDGATFEFLTSITITVSADGLPPREVAQLNPVPAEGRISLKVVPDVDLLPYIQKGAQLTASAKGSAPRQTVRFEGKVVVHVRV
jgi:hypothetical protein